MNRQALEDLYELMNNFPEDRRFDMRSWRESVRITTEAQAVECGTACCAAGWAILALDSWKALGLYFTGPEIGNPAAQYGYLALEFSLNLSEKNTQYIFNPIRYDSINTLPTEVAARIRKVLDA